VNASSTAAISRIVDRLVARDFEAAVVCAPGSRVSAQQLRTVVEQYGRTLVALPNAELVDLVPIQGAKSPRWSVIVPLFTLEEGRSDLSLELTICEARSGTWEVQIDDLRVR
jgi:hypothetical protein